MVMKRPLVDDTKKASACLFRSSMRQSSSINRVVLERCSWKSLFISDTEEASAHLFRYPGRQSSSSLYNSFTWKMVLKMPFIIDSGKTLLCTFIFQVSWETKHLPGDRVLWVSRFAFKHGLKMAVHWWHWGSLCLLIKVSWKTEHLPGDRALWISRVVLERCSWKGHLLMTLWKLLNVCLSLLGDRASAERQSSLSQ